MVELHEALERDEHAQHLFLVDLHAATDRVAVGRRVGAGRGDQVLAPEQQAGALRAANALAARERHEVEAHRGELPEVLDRRHVGRAVVHRHDLVLPAESDELLVPNLPDRVVVVVEEHHRRLRADGALEFVGGLDLDDPHAAVADGVVVAEPVRLLHDDLGLHAHQVRQVDDLLRVAARENPGGPEGHGRRGAAGDHGRLRLDELGDARTHLVVQVVEVHVVLRRVGNRLHDFGRHERRRHVRVGAGGVDEGAHTEFREVVAANRRGGGKGRGRAAEEAADDRQRRQVLEERASGQHRIPSCQRAAIRPTRMRSLPCGCTPMVTRAGGSVGKYSVNSALTCGSSAISVR